MSIDKYAYYKESVQNPEGDVEFYLETYQALKKKKPKTLREDFCGTFAISCEWVKLGKDFEAYGVDLDPEPLKYGKIHYLSELSSDQQKRLNVYNKNVLAPDLPLTDICVAVNFSYYIFKTRKKLLEYFTNANAHLNKNGLFIVDCFGGGQCQAAIEEETVHKNFSYYWDQVNFNPITNEAEFYIHFKPKGQKKIEKVFYYDWRMWTIPELREVLEEAGFKKTTVYWEGTNSKGEGNGIFKPTEQGEECDSWIAYIVAEK